MGEYLEKIKRYLSDQGVEYQALHHPVAYTAQQVAGVQHVPGRQMVKSVIVRAGGRYIMCVMPSIHLLDFEQLKETLGMDDVRLAREEEIVELFPDCAVGAEPPFGSWYDLDTYYDSALDEEELIVFAAGTYTDTVKMRWFDYKKLVSPRKIECWVHI